jgi:hypothetical protein
MKKIIAPAILASLVAGVCVLGCQPSSPDVVVTPSSPTVIHDKVPVPGPSTIIHEHDAPPATNTTVVVPPATNTPPPDSTTTQTTTTQTSSGGGGN